MTLDDALDRLSIEGVNVLAGGTDFYPALKDSPAPESILDVSRVKELRTIYENEKGWTFGAGTTWTDVINAELPRYFDGLKAAATEVGSIQIQNAGTLAGNLCNASPAADGVPPLLVLNATVELASKDTRRRLSLTDFIVGPRSTALRADELLVAIHVPFLPSGARSEFFKLGARRYLIISIAMVAVTLVADDYGNLTEVRIAVGACSAVAIRLYKLEKYLQGISIHEDILSLITLEVFDVLTPIDDVRASGEYRLMAVRCIVSRLLESSIFQLRQCQQAGHATVSSVVSS